MSTTHSNGVVIFRLTDEPGGLGLSCTSDGASMAGVPLLRSTQAGICPSAGLRDRHFARGVKNYCAVFRQTCAPITNALREYA